MKLARITSHEGSRAAIVANDGIIDVTAALGIAPDDTERLLALGTPDRAAAERCLNESPRLPAGSIKFQSPIAQTKKILGVGMNYRSFAQAVERIGIPLPPERIWFYRPRCCLTGPYDEVWLPHGADDLEYEAELAVVIGRRGRYIAPAEAPGFIGGFAVANDLTLRRRVLQSLVFGKSFDTHLPLGPWIVTADEIDNPHDLSIRTWVNGVLRQDSTTADMIAGCYDLVAEISAICTLDPGDIILTGTPYGSGIFQTPPTALAAGDVVKIEIGAIGTIENRIVDEPQTVGVT